jgi:hypothetical protein
MRVTDRFREDNTCHPTKLYDRVLDEIQQKIVIIADFLKNRMCEYTRMSGTSLLTVLVCYRDTVHRL